MLLHVDSRFLSPYALSAFVALKEKGLTFELATLSLAAQANLAPAYQRQSLTARVPMLEDGEFQLSESSAIAEYLEDAYPERPRLYPRDLRQRARARQLQAWLRSDLMALREDRNTEVVFLRPAAGTLAPEARQAANKLIAAAEQLLPASDGDLFGAWCLADTDLALMLKRLQYDDILPPRLAAYVERQWQRPAVLDWLELGRRAALV
ncbi:glutathione transferase [Chromobacterium haemolyticum]|uniref:glutathione transferase n=1 Tax=Chromobacterium haemolyticum TaxID=394935 RepID=UPI000DEFEDED|nr:glutathione transferase [Chromobacterium haemolyticum]